MTPSARRSFFVTGATGFIGGRLAERLAARGDRVVALVRAPERAAHLKALGVELAPGDITDRASLREPMRGVDGVFHLAAWYRIGEDAPEVAERVNVEGTRNVLETMRELGIPKGVYTSTLAVNSDTGGRQVDEHYRHDPEAGFVSHYDRTKFRAHRQVAEPLMAAGLPLVIVMPGAVYGPGDPSPLGGLIRRFLQRSLPLQPHAGYCWGFLDDIVDAHLLAMERGAAGEAYIIAGPCHSLAEAFAEMARLSGVRPPRLQPPAALLRGTAALTGALGRWLPLPADLQPEVLRLMAGVTYYGSNAKARRELGYAPRSLEAGLRPTLAHEMRQLGLPLPPQLQGEA